PCPCDTGGIDRLIRLKTISASETRTFAVFFDLLIYIILLLMDLSYVDRIRVPGGAIHPTPGDVADNMPRESLGKAHLIPRHLFQKIVDTLQAKTPKSDRRSFSQ